MSNDFIQIILGLTIVLIGAAASYAIATIASGASTMRARGSEPRNMMRYLFICCHLLVTWPSGPFGKASPRVHRHRRRSRTAMTNGAARRR